MKHVSEFLDVVEDSINRSLARLFLDETEARVAVQADVLLDELEEHEMLANPRNFGPDYD